jgi:hypothetical protein
MNKKITYLTALFSMACCILPCYAYANETVSDSTAVSEVENDTSKVDANEAVDTSKLPSAVESMASETDTDENSVTIKVGFDQTAGKYGTNRTSSSLSVPVTLLYDTENYDFSLTVPYLMQTGPAGRIASKPVLALGANKIVTESGLGDVIGAITRDLMSDDESGFDVDVGASIKFATADQSKGLGTGKDDYSVQIDVYQDYDKFGLSGTVGYSVLGSPGLVVVNGIQQNIILNNVYYASAGATYKITGLTTAGLMFDIQQPYETGGYEQKDIMANLKFKANSSTRLQIYALKGLSDGSPDWGSGASVSASF